MTQTTSASNLKKLTAADDVIASLGSLANIKIYTTGLATLLVTFTLVSIPSPATITVDVTTDIFTKTAHGFGAGTPVRFTTTGTLPVPLVAGVTYYIRDITTDTFRISLTPLSTVIDITTTGSGTHTIQGQAWIVSSTGVITSSSVFAASGSATGDAAAATYTKADGTVLYTTNVGLQPISFTADITTGIITAPYHNYPNGERVKFVGAALPAPLIADTEYEIGNVTGVGTASAAFKIYKDRAVVNITTVGTAPMTVTNFAGVQINTGTPTIPSLTITTGVIVAIASVSITMV